MFDLNAGAQINNVGVTTSDNGGLSTEQIMEMAINKIMFLSKDAPPAIREQAEAFRQNLKQVLFYHLSLAKKEERATICHVIRQNGHKELANLIRRL
jgi:hypothetical protein